MLHLRQQGIGRALTLISFGLGLASCGSSTSTPEHVLAPSATASPAPSASAAHSEKHVVRDERHGPVQSYAVDLTLDVKTRSARAKATLKVDAEVAAVDLETRNLEVDAVEIEGVGPAQFRKTLGKLRVEVPESAAPSTVTLRYHTLPSSGLVIHDSEAFTGFDTRDWLPCDFDPGHKATFTLRLTAPAEWRVIGPGGEAQRSGDHAEFSLTTPHSAYLFGFVAGAFNAYEGAAANPRAHVFLPSAGDAPFHDAQKLAKLVTDEIDFASAFYADRSGRAYPAPSYSMIATIDNGGQEKAFFSVGDREGFKDFEDAPKEDWLIVHELAHAWWGNALTCDRWADFWLNEAFAVFMTAAVKEVRFGKASYDEEVSRAWSKLDRSIQKGKDRALVGDDMTDADHAGGPIVSAKGPIVLFELRARIGDAAFWDGLKRYSSQGTVVRTEDLEAAMEDASGQDLSAFFHDWTRGMGAPTSVTRPKPIAPD